MKTRVGHSARAATIAALVFSSTLLSAQTRVSAPKNNYTPAQDVELGLKAAAEARQQLPVMRDDEVTSYAEDIGRRLVAAIPANLQHREFRYSFEVVHGREHNPLARRAEAQTTRRHE